MSHPTQIMPLSRFVPDENAGSSDRDRYRLGLDVLVLAALAVDLLTPTLIMHGWIPAPVRWISHAAVALTMVGAVLRMAYFRYIPGGFWIVLLYTPVTVLSALCQGQGFLPILWGWWLLFQFPLMGLFIYLQPRWPDNFSRVLRRGLLIVLSLEVIWQSIQYITGTPPGDLISGSYGVGGTTSLVLTIFFTVCLCLGHWITTGQWHELVISIGLGLIASLFGEMKIFIVVLALLGITAIILIAVRKGSFIRLAGYSILVLLAGMSFVYFYDLVVPGAQNHTLQEFVTSPKMLTDYLYNNRRISGGSYYYIDMGRNYAILYGWNALQKNTWTLLFGWGIGARGESRTLGTAGVGLTSSDLGRSTGTSLLVMLQEHGLFGMTILILFLIWIVVILSKEIRRDSCPEMKGMRFGFIFFTALMPLWLWYGTIWTMRVPMILYWAVLGFLMAKRRKKQLVFNV